MNDWKNRFEKEFVLALTNKFPLTPKSELTDMYLVSPNIYDLASFVKSFTETLLFEEVESSLHCKKPVENGKAVCGIKLDCHLHDKV